MEEQTRGRRRGAGAATSTNINQLEKQGRPGLEAQGGGRLAFPERKAPEELGVRGACSIQVWKTGPAPQSLDGLRNLR